MRIHLKPIQKKAIDLGKRGLEGENCTFDVCDEISFGGETKRKGDLRLFLEATRIRACPAQVMSVFEPDKFHPPLYLGNGPGVSRIV